MNSLDYWKKRLHFLGGASLVLLLVALADLPKQRLVSGEAIMIDGWFGIWLVLLVMNLLSGAVLLSFPRWREIPLPQRLLQATGFFGLAWMTLLALSMRLTVHLPAAYHYTVFGLGIVLAFAAGLSYWKTHRLEEIFP